MKVLILGVTGMLGSAVFRQFCIDTRYQVFGTLRNASGRRYFPESAQECLLSGIDVLDPDVLLAVMERSQPDVVINCVGVIKQLAEANDPLTIIPVNTLLPHRLARLCNVAGARLVHVSTDCVFAGTKGMYTEADTSDAKDLYGRSKYLGEVDYPHAVTLRTSIIGHELSSAHSLVEWFLAQQGAVRGYRRAIFSGLPTVELARLIRDNVIPHPELHGLYHVSAEPINKLDLLTLIAEAYEKSIDIMPDDKLVIDRSLDSSRFRAATQYQPQPWPALVRLMREFA